MLSPIQIRIKAAGGGQEALITLSGDRGGQSYVAPDPSTNPPPFAPPASNALPPVRGIYENLPEEGRDAVLRAKFMFHTKAVIPALEAASAKVLVGGVTYTTTLVRRRNWMGKIDGYSMDLIASG